MFFVTFVTGSQASCFPYLDKANDIQDGIVSIEMNIAKLCSKINRMYSKQLGA